MNLSASFPLLGPAFGHSAYAPIDLGADSPGCQSGELHHFEGLEAYVAARFRDTGAAALYGGYLEERCLYLKSPLFTGSLPARSVHLGVDVWAPVGTPLYAPLRARVWHANYNPGVLDYGATVILRHDDDGHTFFSLYGHLSMASIRRLPFGKELEPGEAFAEIGPPTENGGWVPHVHVQLIANLLGHQGDFPGVSCRNNVPFYRAVCPDPVGLLGVEWL